MKKNKLFFIVSEDKSFWSHRLSLALSAIDAGYDVTLVSNFNKLESKIKNRGVNVININFVRSSKHPFTDLKNIFKLIFILRKEKPDIIHNVALKTILIASIAGLFSKKMVIINAFTGLGYVFSSDQLHAKLIRFFIKPIFKLLFRRSNYWTIFQNPDDMNLFERLGLINLNQSTLIRGSGVETNKFIQSDDLNKIPVVMLASRMLWDKGVGEFVKVAKRAYKNKINAEFMLVGGIDNDNPMSIPLSTLKQWVSNGDVQWEGHSDNMPDMLASASIVCLPSYREGLPKVLLEAAAIGRPLIASDGPGCREIVRDKYNGLLVKMRDADSLYEAVLMLVNNRKMRETMGRNSRTLVETELSTTIINTQTIELYRRVVNASN
ncbi:MAG TPA: glycosyltransferase family 1 protein [Gammaproteobacteria bacterium]|nr:glycosyltransferase family 1 protein [Gammaproteobacteria bacterium]|tara:strand:- start:457 stop:1593 length:1137 start_codon:yes stop_codon:yes gene_type:complete